MVMAGPSAVLLGLLFFSWMACARSEGKEMVLFQEIPSVYGASRFEQKLTEAPSSITIVTASEIKRYGYRTIADVLQSVRGLFSTSDRNYSFVGVRGFARPGDYNTRILLLVDGHRINDNIYNQAFIGTDFPVDIDLIDHIEVIRGPSSSIYGSNAFFGVLNIVTRRGRDLKATELSGEAGSFDTYKGRVSYGNWLRGGLEMLLSGSYYTSKGQDLYFKELDDPATNGGVAENRDDDRFGSLFSRLSYQDFTMEGVFHSREKGIPTAPWETLFNDPRTRSIDERAYADLRYDHRFGSDLGLMARLYYDHYGYDGESPYDFETPGDLTDSIIWKDRSRGDWLGAELQVSKRMLERHHLIFGTESRYDLRQEQIGYYDGTSPYAMSHDGHSYNLAAYLQDEFRILENLIFNAGIRHDYYDTFGGTTNPRVALIFLPYEKTALKLIYGTAFRAPNTYELYFHDDTSYKANPDLKPETIKTYELVWEQYLDTNLRISTSGFYYKIKDLITQKLDPPDGFLIFKNVEEVSAQGLELELEGRWPGDLRTRVSYVLQETEDSETGDDLTGSPRHLAKLNTILPLFRDMIFGGVELRYIGARKTLSGNETGDALVTNVTLFSQNILKQLELSASVYNLFDYDYGDPGSGEHLQDIIQQDGRVFRLKITYSF